MRIRHTAAALAIAAALSLTTTACNDEAFLTEQPIDFVGPANFYRNSDDALAAVNGVYAGFVNTSSSNYYGGLFVMLVEFPTEMMTPYLSAPNERSQVDNYSYTPSHNYIYQSWLYAYAAINRANGVIERVPGISMDATLRDRVVGEAKFLRALNYFNLVRLFGGVPLRTTETTGLEGIQQPRATAAEVYAQIVSDLEGAVATLPGTAGYGANDVGRATRGAAKTLLAKVYMQRAGTGVSASASADWQAALALLQDVAASKEYKLLENYGDLFDMKHEVNSEVIFDIQASRSPGLGQRLSNQCAPRKSNYGTSQNGSFTAEQPFFDAYAIKTVAKTGGGVDTTLLDKRRAVTWQLSFVNRDNPPKIVPWTATATAAGDYGADTPYMRKCLDSLSVGYDEQNYIILRYADNLLMESETINEISGPTTAAYAGVNEVRVRAGLEPLVGGLSQSAFRDSVFAQRRIELTFEGPHGYFDSQRNWAWSSKQIKKAMILGEDTKFKLSKYPKLNPFGRDPNTPIPDKFKLMPIPQRAIDLNPVLRGQQNAGW